LTKAPKTYNGKKDNLFNKCCWKTRYLHAKKLKLDPCLSHCTSINSKWIKDPNIRSETLKLVEEKSSGYAGINRHSK
jgi:hypothetical protein